jgi:predicted transcriptional regulator
VADVRSRERQLEIERMALELLERHDALRAPVDVYALASRLGIDVYRATFQRPGLAGAVEKTGPRSGRIWVNRWEPSVRQRFTTAHEIGHWLLHLQPNDAIQEPDELVEFRDAEGAASEKEREANAFAAALLMPAPLVTEFILRYGRKDVEGLASVFDVSRKAMEIRLQTLEELIGTTAG